MASPEQSQPGRTGRTELDARARSAPVSPSTPDPFGPEPEANQPGHHPPEEQDQPPLDDFAARLGIVPDAATSESGDRGDAPADEAGGGAGAPPQAAGEPARASAEAAPREAAAEDDHDADRVDGGVSVPDPVRQVWSLAVRRGVLPVLGGVRAITDALERAARDSIR